MESTESSARDDHSAIMAQTKRILEEMERLDLRARLLLAEHRHVVATIADLQHQLEERVDAAIAKPSER